jgi:hypothetical protein
MRKGKGTMNATNVQSSECHEAAYYEAGRAVAACCLGIRFSRATIAPDRESIGTVETANLVVSEALSNAPLGRQQLIDRHIQSLLTGAIVAKRIAASSQNSASFLTDADRDCIDNHLKRRGGIAGETARKKHLANLFKQAERLASRRDFQGAVEDVAMELLKQDEFGYVEIMQILIRHAVCDGN